LRATRPKGKLEFKFFFSPVDVQFLGYLTTVSFLYEMHSQGIILVLFTKANVQSKMMNTTTMIPRGHIDSCFSVHHQIIMDKGIFERGVKVALDAAQGNSLPLISC